jgi:hypothetical protein
MTDHRYSTFELDLYWAAPAERDLELDEHLAACDRCRSYVEQLGVLDRQPLASRPRPKRAWVRVAAALAFACALVIVVLAWPRDRTVAHTVAVKGEAGVQVLVHRAAETSVWDPALPVRAHDALALRVTCDGMSQVAVLVPDRTGWRSAFAGACEEGVLPFTLVVDDQPGSEQTAVVLSQAPLDALALQRAVEHETRTDAIWTTRFTFAKETP